MAWDVEAGTEVGAGVMWIAFRNRRGLGFQPGLAFGFEHGFGFELGFGFGPRPWPHESR